MSIIIGLTGPTGAGKSSLTQIANDNGFKVVDCDIIARKATEKDSLGLKELVKVFGEEILFSDGCLNRKKLASIAFKDKESTEKLNNTIFPFITKLVKQEIKGNTILDAPTLFESGINSICQKTIAVLADYNVRKKRILSRDNLTEEEALLRLKAGKDDEFYKTRADIILYNNGDEGEFKSQFTKILVQLREGL